MHEAKMEVLEFVDFLKYPDRYTVSPALQHCCLCSASFKIKILIHTQTNMYQQLFHLASMLKYY